jgi:hypothetical protein
VGLALPVVELLLREHLRDPFTGPVLTLGYPEIEGPYEALLRAFETVGIAPLPLGPHIFRGREKIGTCEAMFGHLGLTMDVLDIAEDREHATIVHDLNEPVPAELHARFGTVIDPGTLEHVFDIRAGFRNVADLARPGGRVIHLNPVNNHVNHGFWQLSPTAHFDYYHANGFEAAHAQLVVYSSGFDYLNEAFGMFPYDEVQHAGLNAFLNDQHSMLAMAFFAKKTARSTSAVVPIQSFFAHYDANAPNTPRFVVDFIKGELRRL